MEKRLIMAIVLSFLVLVGYQLLFNKPKPASEPAVSRVFEAPVGAEAKPTEPPAEPPAAQPAAETQAVAAAVTAGTEKTLRVETSLYNAAWTNRGAVLTSWKLHKHKARLLKSKDEPVEELEMVNRLSVELGRFPFSVQAEDKAVADVLNAALFEVAEQGLSLGDGEKGELRFAFSDGQGLRAEKTYKFTGGTYEVGLEIRAWKNGQEVPLRVLWGPGIGNPTPEEMKQSYGSSKGLAALSGGKVFRLDERKYKVESSALNFVDWAAYEENYFAALFLLPAQKGTAAFLREERDQTPLFFVAASSPESAYIGPKEFDRLRTLGREAKKLINFGFFGAIAEILLVAMKFFHRFIPNWGVSIILLTIIIKILFFPLTYSSSKSMARMAELQPKVKALRAKYKKAKTDIAQRRQMNEEMMRLYKEHGVNPAGGCLPLLVQLPVFWGVFRMLVVAVEFRHSPFVFWIKDLSVRDPLYITPILMGVTQYISQKITPSSADPTQARMMLLMPVIMTVFFMTFQSGLILYWLTTNVLQIGQQAFMNRMMSRKKSENHGRRK
ncbi:MAG: membrane protein insertase YidC [Candidatus Aminicenantes bacterium]|nr:membrane protein insertase YidC [Candidatus Aminicenantes bacterium]